PARLRERIEAELEEEGDEDDGDTPVAGERVHLVEEPEERPREEPEPTVVGHPAELGRGRLELSLQLGSGIENLAEARRGARRKGLLGTGRSEEHTSELQSP